jgi:hypothetical protein
MELIEWCLTESNYQCRGAARTLSSARFWSMRNNGLSTEPNVLYHSYCGSVVANKVAYFQIMERKS